MIARRDIEEMARRIGEGANAECVVLFGSYARGLPSEESDVDLLVIAPSSLPRHRRARELHKSLPSHPFPLDLLVYTPEEVEKSARSPVSFVSSVLREGEALYVRGSPNGEAVDRKVGERSAERGQ